MVWVLHSSWSRPGPGLDPVLMVVLILPWSWSCPGTRSAPGQASVLSSPGPALVLVLVLPWF